MTIENLGNLTLRINGPDYGEYEFSNFSLDNIPYDGAVSVYFITKINFDLSAELLENKSPYAIIVHNPGDDITTRNIDSFEANVPEDGYYEIINLIFPTTTYIEYGLGLTPGSTVNENVNKNIIAAQVLDDTVCFKILSHTQDAELGYYNHIWTGWEDISLNEILVLLELAELTNTLSLDEITIKKETASAFVYDRLESCYISKAMDLLKVYSGDSGFCGTSSLCKDSLNEHKTEIQIRDYLWMAINVIKYCVLNCQYLKALQVLNCVTSCADVCGSIQLTTRKSQGCGCGK